jgi:hypothetical protein
MELRLATLDVYRLQSGRDLMLMGPNESDIASPNAGRMMTYYCQIITSTLNVEERSRKLNEVQSTYQCVSWNSACTYDWQGAWTTRVCRPMLFQDSDKRSYWGSLNRGQLAGHEIN